MPRRTTSVARRRFLSGAGGSALAAVGATTPAVADPGDAVEVNVGYSAESGRQAALDAADAVVREFDFDALTLRLPAEAADALSARGDVRYVEPDGVMHAADHETTWSYDRIDADVTRANGATGSGVDVAIIDTGIDSDHPELESSLGRGKAFVECGAACQCSVLLYCTGGNGNICHEPWDDDNGHGTHVAGIVHAVAPDATLHAVKVLGSSGCGSHSDVANGIEYTADQGWDVATLAMCGSASSVIKDAVNYAHSKGVLLVAPAGNSGPCTDCVCYPAAYSEVVAVSATNRDDSLSDFSSQGPEVELAAPGTDIYSTEPGGYDTRSGTSMAAAHVAGVGALAVAAGYDPRPRLTDTAEDVGLSSNEQGAGLVDAAAAVGLDSSDST